MSSTEENKQIKQFQAIEYLVYWEGGVNSTILAKCIGTSNLTARKHIAAYIENYPDNLKYNANSASKLYIPGDKFHLKTVTNAWNDYLSFITSINILNSSPIYNIFDNSCLASIQNVNCKVFRDIYKAIKQREQITIKYCSSSRPEGLVQIIHPHALVSNGLLWYCRAFCNKEERFKDFSIGRITKIIISEPSTIISQVDHDWENYISLTITANKNLSPAMQKLVLLDYGHTKPFTVYIRRAMARYFLEFQRICTDAESESSNDKHLMLINTKDVSDLSKITSNLD